jgi:SAM-dependent methyltransferase
MRNSENWKPTKFIKKNSGKFISNNDKNYVGAGYRYIVSLQAEYYSLLLKKYAKKRLLDLGCGEVSLYEMYKDKTDEVICCDWNLSFHNNSYLDFVINLNEPLPIKSLTFDTIIFSDVLEHLISPELAFKEIERILNPGGVLFLTMPFLHPLHEEPYDYNRFTEFKLVQLCNSNNLDVLHLQAYGGSFEFLSDFLLKHLARIQPDFVTNIMKSILFKLTFTSAGKRIYSKTSKKYPLGYCLIAEKKSYK